MDDDGLGAEYHKLRARGRQPEPALLPTPDLATVARGFGGEGVVVTDPAGVRDAVVDFLADPRPMVLDVKVARGVLSRSYRRVHFGQQA
jgi:thiamine pyrophosphate-dependent acetolactate synthase large subunit-like protein